MLRSRVLEVDKGESCYIVGTVYLDMPLKPNVLEDVARDQSLPAPPRPRKIYSPEDAVNLEDESGRIKLHGDVLSGLSLVTGMILGVLGHENDNGEFEVEDYCFAGVAPQDILEEHMDIDGEDIGEWIAFVSGLSIGSDRPDDTKFEIRLQLLSEFLAGDLGTSISQRLGARISRLMILGNSLAPYDPTTDVTENLAAQRGNPVRNKPPPKGLPITTEQHPLHILDKYLLELSHSMPIHLLPGNLDPSSTALPQQPFPKGMFRSAKKSKNLHSHTNPTWLGVNGCR
jgi:DNA polymerase delta subunit 2